jgi:threonine synthase
VIHPFLGSAIAKGDLLAMARGVYDTFQHPAVTPLVQLDTNTWVLELFHGPTLAFKDVAMQLLARLMEHVLARRGARTTIIGATSGDTGGAAAEAFRGSKHAEVVILFPDGRVSDVQRRMITTAGAGNIHAVAIQGTFDDCQGLVKGMFNDHGFRDRLALSGVNSINWARIVAQVTYYFVAAAALGAPHRAVCFSVPTGNFGDIFAGWVAKRMGLPVEQLIIASNANDILPRAHASGIYEMREVVATTSPSMDIQVSSNFERYLFEASGRNASAIRASMHSLAKSRRFELAYASERYKADFAAASASETEVAAAIRRVRAESGYLMDPHTACGWVAASKCPPRERGATIVLATAHPSKFPDAVEAITGERPALPARVGSLLAREERMTRLPNDLATVEAYVAASVRSLAGVRP